MQRLEDVMDLDLVPAGAGPERLFLKVARARAPCQESSPMKAVLVKISSGHNMPDNKRTFDGELIP